MEKAFLDFLEGIMPEGTSSESLLRQFAAYARLIEEWSKKFNLVSRGDLAKLWGRDFQDSLTPAQIFPQLSFERAIDVGSGAGFPGIPLNILWPERKFILLETTAKKCRFLREVLASLSLNESRVVSERAETLGKDPEYREGFDLALARALAHPSTALELVMPFVKVGGRALFWASGLEWDQASKISRISEALGSVPEQTRPYRLPEEPRERKLILIRKKIPTDLKYPRRVGIPQKNPM